MSNYAQKARVRVGKNFSDVIDVNDGLKQGNWKQQVKCQKKNILEISESGLMKKKKICIPPEATISET